MNTLLVWDPNHLPSGGFVVDPDYRWMFTEDVIWVGWLPRWYNEIALVDDRYTNWTNFELSFFAYNHTEAILTEFRFGYTYKSLVDNSLHWFFMDIFIGEYDLYIENTFVQPKLNLERQLSMIQIAITTTTIGVLLIGFLIDFSRLREGWRLVYVGFIFITLGLSFFYTTLPLF